MLYDYRQECINSLFVYGLLLPGIQCMGRIEQNVPAVLLNEIRSSESSLRPAPVHIPVFAGLGLHSTWRGIPSCLIGFDIGQHRQHSTLVH